MICLKMVNLRLDLPSIVQQVTVKKMLLPQVAVVANSSSHQVAVKKFPNKLAIGE